MHLQRNTNIMTVFKDKTNLYNMYKINFIKLQNVCDPYIYIDMFVKKWIFFRRFRKSPQFHRSVLRKMTKDLWYFWDIYETRSPSPTLNSVSDFKFFVFFSALSHLMHLNNSLTLLLHKLSWCIHCLILLDWEFHLKNWECIPCSNEILSGIFHIMKRYHVNLMDLVFLDH